MRYRQYIFAVAAAVLAGCAPQTRRPVQQPLCPGKSNIADAAAALALQRQNLVAFQASAEGVISWMDENGKEHNERIGDGPLAFVPPDKVYFKGSIGFKEARFGANEMDFWLRIKFELDTYWWGTRKDAEACGGTLLFDPAAISEAIGIVNVTPQWMLFNRDDYDILSLNEGDIIRKRIYVNTCDYRVEMVEYFNAGGIRQVSIELSDYAAGENGLMVPAQIRATSYNTRGLEESSVRFELKNIRPLPSERQKPKLFMRPQRDGYGKVLKLNENCEFVEE